MAKKIDLTASALLALFEAVPEAAMTDELKALKQQQQDALSAEQAKKLILGLEASILAKVKTYKEKHLDGLDIAGCVNSIKLEFHYTDGKFTPFGTPNVTFASDWASDEMLALCAALAEHLDETEDNDLFNVIESVTPEGRFADVVEQSQFDRESVKAIHTAQHSQHWANDLEIPADVTSGNVAILYNSAAELKAHSGEGDAGWSITSCSLGKVKAKSTGSGSGNGTNVKVPGFKTNREYLETIADQKVKDKLKEHNGDWKKINASQHIHRIEKTFTSDDDKLWMKEKGLV